MQEMKPRPPGECKTKSLELLTSVKEIALLFLLEGVVVPELTLFGGILGLEP